jgi:outer membrane protein assembly factor BamB
MKQERAVAGSLLPAFYKVFGLIALCLFLPRYAIAHQIVGWRSNGSGEYPDANPPTEWSTSKNVLWCTPMPGWSNSSPTHSKGFLFVCAEPSTLLCVQASDGKILWQRSNDYRDMQTPEEAAKANEALKSTEAAEQELRKQQEELIQTKRDLRKTPDDKELTEKLASIKKKIDDLKKQMEPSAAYRLPPTHGENGYSSCTPTTDGKFVYAMFGNGVVACYDFDGKRKWIKLAEKPTDGWGHSSSPLLIDHKLVVLVNSLIALNAETGEVVWRAPAQHRYGTPLAAKVGETEVIVTPGGEIVRVSDGIVMAQGISDLTYCAPAWNKDVVYFIQNGGKAIRLAPESGGRVRPDVLWQTSPVNDRYYASPVVHDGLIYATNQAGDFSVIEGSSGNILHHRKLNLGATIYSSVTLAKNLLYISAENGATVILEVGPDPKEIARNQLEKFRSSPVFIGNRMYIRSREKLYCIGGN